MGKKAQVTIFIIIGILVMAAVTIFLVIRQQAAVMPAQAEAEIAAGAPADFRPAVIFTQKCLQRTLEDGIDIISRRGGYLDLPERSTVNASTNTAYYFYLEQDISPTEDVMKSELTKYLDTQLPFCLRNYADFPGITAIYGPLASSITIDETGVKAETGANLRLALGSANYRQDTFQAKVPARLLTLFRAAKGLTAKQAETPDSICMSCIADAADENSINITVLDYQEDTLIFALRDDTVPVGGDALRFRFANRYLPPKEEEEVLPPSSIIIAAQTAEVGKEFTMTVPGAPDRTFSDTTSLFDIDSKTGEIKFTANATQIGDYQIWITRTLPDESSDVKGFKLTIKEAAP